MTTRPERDLTDREQNVAQPIPRSILPGRVSLLADYAALLKPRVSTMVVITAAGGFYLGSLRSGISPFHLGAVEALAGIAVVTCGSSILNQALERRTDTLMPLYPFGYGLSYTKFNYSDIAEERS